MVYKVIRSCRSFEFAYQLIRTENRVYTSKAVYQGSTKVPLESFTKLTAFSIQVFQ